MDILVCFKVVPDLDQLPGSDWEIDSRFRIETGFVQKMINPYDESALELSLKLCESSDRPVHLTALTIGDKKSEIYLKTLNALKFARTVRIEQHADIRFSPEKIAAVISGYVQKMGRQDLILMGAQSGEGDNAKTPLFTAEMLHWPCVTQVIQLEPCGDDGLKVTSMVDGGLLKQMIKMPCVLAVGNAPNANLRVPTLKDRAACSKQAIEVRQIEEFMLRDTLEDSGQDGVLKGLEIINRRREGLILAGATPAEKARVLYDAYLKEWLEP
jgi:electron transfer flavoprotein beta subunit